MPMPMPMPRRRRRACLPACVPTGLPPATSVDAYGSYVYLTYSHTYTAAQALRVCAAQKAWLLSLADAAEQQWVLATAARVLQTAGE